MSAYDAPNARYRECHIFTWDGDVRHCRRCNHDLPKRRRTWCSDKCEGSYRENHFWTDARPARLRLDGFRCQRCGALSEPRDSRWELFQRHGWQARLDDRLLTPYLTRRLWTGPALEVHHVYKQNRIRQETPSGCHNHLSLLVTLCRPCHKRETVRENRTLKVARFLDQHPHLQGVLAAKGGDRL